MHTEEARAVLAEKVAEYRKKGYQQLLELLDNPIGIEAIGPSGTTYNLEVEAMWDHEPKPDLRVFVALDDGSLWRSISPLVEDFIILPDGSFVGE